MTARTSWLIPLLLAGGGVFTAVTLLRSRNDAAVRVADQPPRTSSDAPSPEAAPSPKPLTRGPSAAPFTRSPATTPATTPTPPPPPAPSVFTRAASTLRRAASTAADVVTAPARVVVDAATTPARTAAALATAAQEMIMPDDTAAPADTTSDTAIQRAAELSGLPERLVRAIARVESGRGLNPHAFRFEPHVFHRLTTVGDNNSAAAQALQPAQAKHSALIPWTPAAWPSKKHSLVSAETNWAAFLKAFTLAPDAAVRASSWGAFQVLDPIYNDGAPNYAAWMKRYGTPTAPNENHWDLSVELMGAWFAHRRDAVAAAKAAMTKAAPTAADWLAFAKLWNGAGAVANAYHTNLAREYAALA